MEKNAHISAGPLAVIGTEYSYDEIMKYLTAHLTEPADYLTTGPVKQFYRA